MRYLCFYFQVHQPVRLRTFRFFDIGSNHYYYDDHANRTIMQKVANKCYIPTNAVLLDLIKEYGQQFRIAFSITGTALDQMEKYAPQALESFQRLAQTGCVEFLAETYAHSLCSLKSRDEFFNQVDLHSQRIQSMFGQKPRVFRNTELIYSDQIGDMVSQMGFKAMLTEGAKHILGWKSPNYIYCSTRNPKLKLLLKNFRLSDDIAFRFSNRNWSEWPLTADKFVSWLNALPGEEEIVNLFMDYETFGEHQWADTGIFEFMRHLPRALFTNSNYKFITPADAAEIFNPVGALHVPFPISWADEERDLTAWLGNDLQDDAFEALYRLEPVVRKCADENMLKDWEYLQTSDHFYYMCTKFFSDGDVHKYFNPYDTPYEAFINYMNILSDFSLRLKRHAEEAESKKPAQKETKRTLKTNVG